VADAEGVLCAWREGLQAVQSPKRLKAAIFVPIAECFGGIGGNRGMG
jgi:hypothetical protein